jgi:hypothetical protein
VDGSIGVNFSVTKKVDFNGRADGALWDDTKMVDLPRCGTTSTQACTSTNIHFFAQIFMNGRIYGKGHLFWRHMLGFHGVSWSFVVE